MVNHQMNQRRTLQGHRNGKKLPKTIITITKVKCTITKGEYQLLSYPWPLKIEIQG